MLLPFVVDVPAVPALACMVGVASRTREKVHSGLPSVGSQAVLILVTAAGRSKTDVSKDTDSEDYTV